MKKSKTIYKADQFILALFFFAVLQFPQFIKLVHKHTHEGYHSNSSLGLEYDTSTKKCAICEFEFSVFSFSCNSGTPEVKAEPEFYRLPYYQAVFLQFSGHSFLLRAPPYSM
jgi:hypothetical protein